MRSHVSTDRGAALSARFAEGQSLQPVSAGGRLPGRILWMPGGVHEISCTQSGKQVRTFVLVDRETARVAQRALESHNAATAHRPHFDLGHAHQEASAWPLRFEWCESPQPGVYADVEWSQAGLAAVSGRNFRTFSPQFFTDRFPFTKTPASRTDPARVVDVPLNMGGLVNDPAFREQVPLFAARARGELTKYATTMNDTKSTETDLAAQDARVAELETELASLKAATAGDDRAALQAREAELADTRRRLDALQAENSARVQRDAKVCVAGAVARGALAASNTALQQHWQRLIEADVKNAELLNAMPGSAALAGGRIVRPRVTIEREDIIAGVPTYSEWVFIDV